MSRLARAAGLVSVATLVSRVFGLLRDSVRAALFGNAWISDAIDVAFKIPNLFRDLFAEGAFSGAFVPTITHVRQHRGDAAALTLLNRVLSTLLLYVGVLVAAIALAAPVLVRVIASPRFVAESGVFADTVLLVRLLAPFLLFICLAVAAMGALNVWGRFFLPALSPATQNMLLVAGGIGVYRFVDAGVAAAVPWALLLLAGGLLQFLIQVPALVRIGWRPRFLPDVFLRAPETRQILHRMAPVVVGLAATHVSILVNTRLATADEGGQSNLYYAFRLVHLPVGLVGVAVGTAVLAEASRNAARGDAVGLRRTLAESTLLCLGLAAPAAAGLLALGDPIAKLLFQWGTEMTAAKAAAIGETIRYFSAAVIFYCLVKVVVPVFYAQGRMRVPVAASLAAVAANIAAALALHPSLRWRGLALAVAIGQATNLAVLLAVLAGDHGRSAPGLWGRVGKIALAAAACGAAAGGTAALLPDLPGAGARALRALLPVAVGGAAYLGAGLFLRSPDVLSLGRVFRRLDSGA